MKAVSRGVVVVVDGNVRMVSFRMDAERKGKRESNIKEEEEDRVCGFYDFDTNPVDER